MIEDIFGTKKKKQEEAVGWVKLNIEEIRNVYSSPGRSVVE